MASIVKLSKGKNPIRAIDFVGADGARRRVRLGAVAHEQADTAKRRIQHLVTCQKLGDEPDGRTVEWLCGLSDRIHQRVANQGLCAPRVKPEAQLGGTLGDFLDSYLAGRANQKPNTKRIYEATRRHLIDHFGADRRLGDISAGDADDFQEKLRNALSAATVSREVKRAKQFFRAAVRKRLIPENPFADLAAPAQTNSSREFFVTRDMTAKVLAACPDAQWRLIVALSRYGGLRCPSEHLARSNALQRSDSSHRSPRAPVPLSPVPSDLLSPIFYLRSPLPRSPGRPRPSISHPRRIHLPAAGKIHKTLPESREPRPG